MMNSPSGFPMSFPVPSGSGRRESRPPLVAANRSTGRLGSRTRQDRHAPAIEATGGDVDRRALRNVVAGDAARRLVGGLARNGHPEPVFPDEGCLEGELPGLGKCPGLLRAEDGSGALEAALLQVPIPACDVE